MALLSCLSPFALTQQANSQGAPEPAAQKGAVLSARPAADAASAPGNGAIQLDVVVTDKSGKPVSGLGEADFTLLDNNQPGKILSFHAYDAAAQKPDPPVEVIVVLDTVNIGFEEVSYTRQQLENFLRQDAGRLAQPMAVYWLTNEGVEAQQEPTLDGNALAAQLEASEGRLRSVTRAAGAYGAIELFQLSVKMLGAIAVNEAKKPGRKLLIWAGPGWPMLVGPGIDFSPKAQQGMFEQIVELSTLLREGHIDIYSVTQGMPGPGTFIYQSYLKGVKKKNQASPANLALKVLAVQSGGLVVSPTNDLAASISACVRDTGAFYTLSFDPPPADGPNQYHELKVKIGRPGLTARTNTGYYDQPAGPGVPGPAAP
jgi:VWFA-related protein